MLVLGVDGGNTKTIAVVANETGQVLGVGRGGCTDVHGINGPAGACAELSRVIEAALSAATCSSADLDIGVFSLAGADWPEDHQRLHSHLVNGFDFGFDPVVVNDAIGGLRSAAPNWEGIALICGTGNAVGARRRDGASFHLGFWPDTIGAVVLSGTALDAVQRDFLGLGPPTSLTDRALDLYGVTDPLELLHLFTKVDGYGREEQVKMS
ncbi:MAG: BadF/BadG/BcrA/BcrD ATPase family protein, partial [Acidimicrobiales bacterium]